MFKRISLASLSLLLAPALATAATHTLVGRFTHLDKAAPSCGLLYTGASAIFLTRDGRRLHVIIPCIEMQTVHAQNGRSKPLRLGVAYRIHVSTSRPSGLDYPTASAGALYLRDIRESNASSSNSFARGAR